jgi:DNA-binding NtrC family response regulator
MASAVLEAVKAQPAKAKAKLKVVAPKKPAFTMKAPQSETLHYFKTTALRSLTHERYSYRDAVRLFETALLDAALQLDKGNKKAAGARLGISRDHVRDYYRRGAALVR